MSSGILFNHESELRGEEFVTRKVSLAVAKIFHGKQEYFEIGNLDSKRDWGYAVDYVEGMWRMLQQEKPDDFILATGVNHTIREFIERAFAVIGKTIVWEGVGINEIGKDRETGKILVKVNPEYFRPAEVEELIGDYGKAKAKLTWEPKVMFDGLVKIMVESDVNALGGVRK